MRKKKMLKSYHLLCKNKYCNILAFVQKCTVWNRDVFLTHRHVFTLLNNWTWHVGFAWVFLACDVIITIYTARAAAEITRFIRCTITEGIQTERPAVFIQEPDEDRSTWKSCFTMNHPTFWTIQNKQQFSCYNQIFSSDV